MIEATEQDGYGQGARRRFTFLVIDAHHHIGEDEDGHKNLNVNGSFDFFRNVWRELQKRYEDPSKLAEYQKPRFKITNITPPRPLVHLESEESHANSWLVDQFIAFPFCDVYRNKIRDGEDLINYNASNSRIASLAGSHAANGRLIGYCRLDPQDGDRAIKELERCHNTLGLSGIKLHPKSDKWNTKEFFDTSTTLRMILKKAMMYKMPVIFDCRFESTLRWIYDLVEDVRKQMLDCKFTEVLVNSCLKVIVAHVGFLQNTDLIFQVLSHPNIYGDLTGLFSDKIKLFIEKLKANVTCQIQNLNDERKTWYWATKVVLGSDFDYFEAFHIVDQLLYYFSQDFYELVQGNINVIKDIIARNMQRLLPIAIKPTLQTRGRPIAKISASVEATLDTSQYSKFISRLITTLPQSRQAACILQMRNHDEYQITPISESPITGSHFFGSAHKIGQLDFSFFWKDDGILLAGVAPEGLN
nr:amidohydrolase family protein [Candidatus Sigynarchaeota archaeon]